MKGSEWAHVHTRATVALEEAEEAVKFLTTVEGDGAAYTARKRLDVFGKEIDRLRLAIADDEASHSEIRQRRDIIAAFENKQAGLDVQMQNYTGLTGHRAELLGGRIQHEQQGSPSISSMLRAQEQSMKEQDQRIEIMSGAARNTKMIAAEIQREVDEQTHLLDGLESGLTSAGREIRNVNENVSSTPTNPYTLKAFCTLLWALVLLLLVLFWFLGH
uniref:t-SNARE coiled-coil homology domain-containing protein n=1 Tax=Rhodosorus marinus TaxID=101924 RepID=A0A7S0BHW0_9RHOD|mmetsp:Transcript_17144/g.24573  ORF Transcript_17144/g.24573 Transcript_17144/m.24573 type:complete len:217 (+) Transcript_17144:251-901(+)